MKATYQQTTSLRSGFAEAVEANPNGNALIIKGQPVTFEELGRTADRYANGLANEGVGAGTRIAFMVPPAVDALALFFAFLKVGAVPILIDPGMDMRNLRVCLDEAEPEVFVGIPLAHQARLQLGWGARTVRLNVTAGERGDWDGVTLEDFTDDSPFEAAERTPEDDALILFTTGSTGPPKGAVYSQANSGAQLSALREVFRLAPGRIDMPTLPTFAPPSIASGMTCVIPDMDFTRPGSVDAASLIAQIEEHQVTSMFGSPALLDRLSRYGVEHGVKLPMLDHVVTAAAPVPPTVLERFAQMLEPSAELTILYGATESLPVSVIDAREVISETAAKWAEGAGTCVGKPVESIEAKVIKIDDGPMVAWSDDLLAPEGEIGELVVKGPVVSLSYRGQPRSNSQLKIYDPADGRIWHRSGDAARIDEHGRIWMQGRVSHRVRSRSLTYFTEPAEAVFNQHPRVKRTALVGVGRPGEQRPVLCVELEENEAREGSEELRREILALKEGYDWLSAVDEVLFHPSFPVDIRHNSKIFREELAEWAADRAGDTGLEAAKQAFEAFANHDPSFLELIHPDIECKVPEGLPGGGEFRGQLALLEFFAQMTELFENPMVTPEKFVMGDEELVVFGRWTTKAKATGREIDEPITMRWRFRDRVAVGYQSYIDTAPIQAALQS